MGTEQHHFGHDAPDIGLLERASPTDVSVVCSVPVVLGLVYLLPLTVRQSLVFDYTAPTLTTAFASAFVHLDFTHLLVNVGLYLVVVPVGFVLSVASGRRQRFYAVFVTFVFVLPVLLAYLNLAVPRSASTFGFSGVVMAFAGYIPFALADYLDARVEVGPAMQVGPVLFFTSLGVISVASLQSVIHGPTMAVGASGLALAALLAALLYGLGILNRGGGFRTAFHRLVETPGAGELVVVSLALVFAMPVVGFPPTPATGGGVVNLYVHLLGYALGFIAPFATAATAASSGRIA